MEDLHIKDKIKSAGKSTVKAFKKAGGKIADTGKDIIVLIVNKILLVFRFRANDCSWCGRWL